MQSIMKHIYPAIDKIVCPCCETPLEELSVKANVLYQVGDLLKKDTFIAQKVKANEITVVGAKYELKTGKIIILTEKG